MPIILISKYSYSYLSAASNKLEGTNKKCMFKNNKNNILGFRAISYDTCTHAKDITFQYEKNY